MQRDSRSPVPLDEIRQHTTSFSVADADGNVVCITQSLGAKFGCGVVVPGHGVCLNNFLLLGRGRSARSECIAARRPIGAADGTQHRHAQWAPRAGFGTPGSYGICQTQPQALIQHVDFGLGIQDAIEAPRARLFYGREVLVESRIPATTIAALCERGHAAEAAPPWTTAVGGMHGVAIDPTTGVMTGGCDPRRDGFVAAA